MEDLIDDSSIAHNTFMTFLIDLCLVLDSFLIDSIYQFKKLFLSSL